MAITAPALPTRISSHGPRHAAGAPPAVEAARDRLTAAALLDEAIGTGESGSLRPVRYVARWWDGTGYVRCLVVRTSHGRRRVIELEGGVVVVPSRARPARRALRRERAGRREIVLPGARSATPVRRITQDIDVRTCPWPGCGQLAVIPAPGLGAVGEFPCGHDS